MGRKLREKEKRNRGANAATTGWGQAVRMRLFTFMEGESNCPVRLVNKIAMKIPISTTAP